MKRIHDSLDRALERHRIVFWYDATGEWADAFAAYERGGVTPLRVERNAFGTKVRLARAPADARFLVYAPTPRPADADNWLLDLLLQGHEFRADKASLLLEDAGLPREYRYLVEDHAAFFGSTKRVQAIREMKGQYETPRDVKLRMMSVLTGTSADLDALLLHALHAGADDPEADPVASALGPSALVEPFWEEVSRTFGYNSSAPTLRDFAVTLFRGANPLDPGAALHPHARVFMQRWKDSQRYCESFRTWSRRLEEELRVRASLDADEDRTPLGSEDAFEAFDRYTLHRLCAAFDAGTPAADLRATIEARRSSFWYEQHRDGYQALEHVLDLREGLAAAELTLDSLADGVRKYRAAWWKLDRAYRRSTYHLRRYGNLQVVGRVAEWVEKSYVNNFLLPLTDRWSDQVSALERWACEGVHPQRRFFESYVQPFRDRGQKVFVIVSDALRYEAAAEFAERLLAENRWSADVDALFGALPSYTQLGMASLLPGRSWAVDPATAGVTLDGQSASGTTARSAILQQVTGGRATAIQAEDFLELNTKTEGRALMRDHDVVYVFHNHIDKVGDDLKTEGKTFEAVEQAFEELEAIMKKAANINATSMLLTADHGFLFQQNDVPDADMVPLPAAEAWTNTNRRFALGRGITVTPGVKVFTAADLSLEGDWDVAFPLSLGRFPLRGSGKRYVHGGTGLHEVLIPVVRIRKKRSDDTRTVEVDLLRAPSRITTGQVSIVLFQESPVQEKTQPRTLRVGLFSLDGTALSDTPAVIFDSSEPEARMRETTLLLTLSHQADAHNNREVELRLEETLPGTTQRVAYKTHRLKLQKPFASDFDEF